MIIKGSTPACSYRSASEALHQKTKETFATDYMTDPSLRGSAHPSVWLSRELLLRITQGGYNLRVKTQSSKISFLPPIQNKYIPKKPNQEFKTSRWVSSETAFPTKPIVKPAMTVRTVWF